jgi:1,2-diacylglycerol 3-beta-galactosyltransferase
MQIDDNEYINSLTTLRRDCHVSYRVLILTSDAGFGHRRAAQAIDAALTRRFGEDVETRIENPLDAPELPDILRMIETTYDGIVTDDAMLYQLAYNATDAPVVAGLMQRVATTVLDSTLTRYVEDFRPNVLVTTYPAYTYSMIRTARKMDRRIPVDVIVTDLIGVHSLWFHEKTDLTFVPTGGVLRQALDAGLAKSQLHLSGMPVHPRIAELQDRDPAELRRKLGWDTDMMTALIVGSSRTGQTMNITRLLDRSGLQLQLVAVGGGDPKLTRQLEQAEWRGVVHTYGLVENMAEMMRAADLIICKAGGLIVSEALASGLPLILFEALPGQEVGNVRYVAESGAGEWSPGAIGALTTVYAWLARDRTIFEQRRAAARRVGKPRAAYDVAEQIMHQAERAASAAAS